MPPGVDGHFGPELRRLVLALYHRGQVTAGRLVTLLCGGRGVLISKRQVVRLLIAGKQGFLDEARDVLRAGLTKSGWITVDDTGARHKGKNGYCTQIGNACLHLVRNHGFEEPSSTSSSCCAPDIKITSSTMKP